MGIGTGISRNNIAYANARRDVAIYRELAQTMMERAASVVSRDRMLEDIARRFSLEGFFAVDSSTVSLDIGRHPWCVPQKGVGGGEAPYSLRCHAESSAHMSCHRT